MSRGPLAEVSRLLGRPLFGTFVVPKDARVDPALFPEEDFPVYCPKCAYLLRGLPGGTCPECGKSFERGTLLVQQYVFGKQLWKRTPLGRRARRFVLAGFACMLISSVGKRVPIVLVKLGLVDWEALSARISVTWTIRLLLATMVVLVLGFGLVLTGILCIVVEARRLQYTRKRRAVIAAIRAAASADEASSDQ